MQKELNKDLNHANRSKPVDPRVIPNQLERGAAPFYTITDRDSLFQKPSILSQRKDVVDEDFTPGFSGQ